MIDYNTCMVGRYRHRSAWRYCSSRNTVKPVQRIESQTGLSTVRRDDRAVRRRREWLTRLVKREWTVRHGRRSEGYPLRFQVTFERHSHNGRGRGRRLKVRIWTGRDGRQVVFHRSVETLLRHRRRYARRRITC